MRGLKDLAVLALAHRLHHVSMGLPRMRGLKVARGDHAAHTSSAGFDGIAPHEGTERPCSAFHRA